MAITDKELLREFIREITQLVQRNVVIRLSLTPEQAMALIASVQLVSRHPFYTGPSRLIARRIVDRMQSDFLQYGVPHILEVIRRGWSPEYDESWEKDDDGIKHYVEKGDQS